MAAPPPATPPEAIPPDQQEDVERLSKGLSVLLVSKQIPWRIQGELARQGYTTVEDLADRWDSPEEARNHGPRELDFTEGNHGFTAQSTAFTAMRLLQAVRAARMLATIPGTAHTQGALPRSTTPGGSPLEISLDRRTLEETYMKTYKVSRPRLESQGSDALLKRQHRFIARGEIEFIPVKHLISALPEEGERPTKTSKRFTLDGWEGHEEEEVRSNPTTRRQLERMHMVFRTTLLMCTASAPQFANLCITKEELDSWYEWFYGEDIAGRSPPPSEAILLYAERNAWRKIHDMVHGGTTLSEALRTIKLDLLFWTSICISPARASVAVPTIVQSELMDGHVMQRQELTARVIVHTPPSDRRPKQVPLALNKPPQHRGLHQDSPPRGRTSPVHTTTHVTAPRALGYTLRRHHERVKDGIPDPGVHPQAAPRKSERPLSPVGTTPRHSIPDLGYTLRRHHERVKDHSPRWAPHPVTESRTLGYTPRRYHERVKDHSPRWAPHQVTESRALGYTPRRHHERVISLIPIVTGGPNCRTWSILHWFPKPGAPKPVRGRPEEQVWGLPGLTPRDQEDVDNDSTLLLRQMYLTSLAYQGVASQTIPHCPGSFLEHPSDPKETSKSPNAHRCSTIWNTKAYQHWAKTLRHRQVKFDQCQLGQW